MKKKLAFAFLFIAHSFPVNAYTQFNGKSLCHYSKPLDNQDTLYLFKSGKQFEDYTTRIQKIFRAPINFDLNSSNIASTTAVLSNKQRLVLYDAFTIDTEMKNEEGKWKHLFILAHQIAHHSMNHDHTFDSRLLQMQEAEADALAARALQSLGATREDLESAIINWPYTMISRETQRTRYQNIIAVWQDGHNEDNKWTSSDTEGIPSFPWLPPKASAMSKLDHLFNFEGNKDTYGDTSALLEKALIEAGYNQNSYYAVPNGFALVTQLEQINNDGSPKNENFRWSSKFLAPQVFNLKSYLRALFTSSPGHYRIIVFVVTPDSFHQGKNPTSFNVAKDWFIQGNTKLPPSIAKTTVPSQTSVTALIYEFRRESYNTQALVEIPSSISGIEHLRKSMLLGALSK